MAGGCRFCCSYSSLIGSPRCGGAVTGDPSRRRCSGKHQQQRHRRRRGCPRCGEAPAPCCGPSLVWAFSCRTRGSAWRPGGSRARLADGGCLTARRVDRPVALLSFDVAGVNFVAISTRARSRLAASPASPRADAQCFTKPPLARQGARRVQHRSATGDGRGPARRSRVGQRCSLGARSKALSMSLLRAAPPAGIVGAPWQVDFCAKCLGSAAPRRRACD